MLAKNYRLRQAKQIARVYKQGSYGGVAGLLSVKALVSGRPNARVVVVVGKKVSKKAVIRNRLRRRLVELLHSDPATLRTGYDIVITVHSDLSDLSPTVLGQHLTTALGRVGLGPTRSGIS